jgi:tight adherence protein C
MFQDAITLGAFLLVFALVFVLGDVLTGGRRRVLARNASASFFRQDSSSASYAGWFWKLMSVLVPQLPAEIVGIKRDLGRAGFYSPSALNEYLGTRNLLLLMVLVTTVALSFQSQSRPELQRTVILTGWVVGILVFALPRMLLRLQANARVARIQKSLPDALDVVTMCLTGGLPLQEALGRVTEEMQYAHPEVAVELEIVRKQSDANTLSHAMRQFANRIDLPDVRSMAALVSQTERLGTNVATAVREFADSLRRGARFRAEERANKASIKLLFPVILCLAPPVYILLCGPSVLQLREFLINENRPGGMLTGGMSRGRANANYGDAAAPGVNGPGGSSNGAAVPNPANNPVNPSATSAVGDAAGAIRPAAAN